ncbi:DUF58 domain-containing protein [Pseudoxanthomonas sp.]|uniref:DUF58 domain-containing protein n=1 Tax=Pseudoxanthomonas sp. TaxID=1871049 RepID=UPI003F7EAB48
MATALRQRASRRLWLLARPRQPESLPVRLDRRRVYVLPTGFGLFYALLVGTMLAGALNYNNNPALLLALLLASAGLASLIAAHLQLSGLRLDALSADPVAAGQPLRVQFALSARDHRARRGLRLACQDVSGLVPPMTADAIVAELSLPTQRRGWLDPGRVQVWTTQPLGLARAWAWFWPRQSLLVYPAPETNGPPLPEAGGGGTRARQQASGEDVHHLRAYRSGDPLRAIAWKPSARRDHLLVREFEQPVGVEVDLAWNTLAALSGEQRIRRLAHWVDLAEREGRRYRLRLPGDVVLGPSQGPAHRHACLRALALLPDA